MEAGARWAQNPEFEKKIEKHTVFFNLFSIFFQNPKFLGGTRKPGGPRIQNLKKIEKHTVFFNLFSIFFSNSGGSVGGG